MDKYKKSPMAIILLGVAVLIAFVVLVFFVFLPSFSPNSQLQMLVEENHPPEPEEGMDIITLKAKTPYQGINFSFTFDENEGIFYVYIDPANQEAGDAEFNDFLSQNGIPNKASFEGLQTSSVPVPTLAP